jgi:serine/threonine-protein kinase
MAIVTRSLAGVLCLIGLLLPHAARADRQTDLAERAADVLRQRCAACHTGPKARGGLSILDHKALLQGRAVVVEKNHEKSELWQLVECGTMPPGDRPKLTPPEIAALGDWIDGGAPVFPPQIGEAYVLRQILKDIRSQDAAKRLNYRYVSFNHLLADGEHPIDPDVCQAALTSALNHLSMMRVPVRPVSIDPTRTVFRIDLAKLGWEANPYKDETNVNLYDLILLEYPFASLPERSDDFTALEDEYFKLAKLVRPVPFVRGDWLVTLATQPPLYEDLLGLPRTLHDIKEPRTNKVKVQGLESMLQVKPNGLRGGIAESGGMAALRFLERRDAGPGPFWRTYELEGKGITDLVRLAPEKLTRGPGQVLFGLPNGLYGFYLVNKFGQRLEIAPAGWVHNPKDPDADVRTGLSCIRCHDQGVKPFKDVARTALEESKTRPPNYDDLLKTFVGPMKLDEHLKTDADRYTEALKTIYEGKVPNADPLGALSDLYVKKWANRPSPRSVDPRGPRLRDLFAMQPQLLDRAGKPMPRGDGEVPIVPLDGLTVPQYTPADAKVDVEVLSWDKKKNAAAAVFRQGDELVIRIRNKGDEPIYIELIGFSLESGRCFSLLKAGTKLAPGEEARFPKDKDDFLKIDETPGKDLYTLYASRTNFAGGKVLSGKSGQVGDRFVHRFYESKAGNRVLPEGLIKKTLEVETVEPGTREK